MENLTLDYLKLTNIFGETIYMKRSTSQTFEHLSQEWKYKAQDYPGKEKAFFIELADKTKKVKSKNGFRYLLLSLAAKYQQSKLASQLLMRIR